MKLFLAIFLSIFIAYIGYVSGISEPVQQTTSYNQITTHRDRVRDILNSNRGVTIYLDQSIDARHAELIEETLGRFKLLSRRAHVRLVDSRSDADVVVYNWNNTWNETYVGFQPIGSDIVLLDVNKLYIDEGFQIAFMHEFGHWLGMKHICRWPNEVEECSSVGTGPAVLNPAIGYLINNDCNFTDFFTSLDFAEFRRATRLGN